MDILGDVIERTELMDGETYFVQCISHGLVGIARPGSTLEARCIAREDAGFLDAAYLYGPNECQNAAEKKSRNGVSTAITSRPGKMILRRFLRGKSGRQRQDRLIDRSKRGMTMKPYVLQISPDHWVAKAIIGGDLGRVIEAGGNSELQALGNLDLAIKRAKRDVEIAQDEVQNLLNPDGA